MGLYSRHLPGNLSFGGLNLPCPVCVCSSYSACSRAVIKNWPGVTDPFPDVFDPLGFSDKASVEEVRRWREAEITHGEW